MFSALGPRTFSISPPDLSIQIRVQKAVIRIQLAERVLRKQYVRSRPFRWAPVSTLAFSSQHGHLETYTVKQSNMNAIAIGEISSLISSGIGGVSPFAIL
jgi:hypothetical protein